jgi:hypothetical protein
MASLMNLAASAQPWFGGVGVGHAVAGGVDGVGGAGVGLDGVAVGELEGGIVLVAVVVATESATGLVSGAITVERGRIARFLDYYRTIATRSTLLRVVFCQLDPAFCDCVWTAWRTAATVGIG